MTLVGHGLTGAALGLLATPRGAGRPRLLLLLLAFAALGNVPDFPLPYWGHYRYEVSHSLFVTVALAGGLGAVLWISRRARERVGGGQVIVLGAAAWCSHLLLDSFYNHGKGVAILWPLSTGRLALALPWFSTVRRPLWHLDGHSLRVMAVELAFFGGLFLLTAGVRWALLRSGARGSTR